MTRMKFLLTVTVLLVLATKALAGDGLDLAPNFATATAGSTLELDLEADFVSSVIGGEVRVDYDPEIVFLSGIDWDPNYGDDPELRCPSGATLPGGRGCEGDHAFIAMGSLSGLGTGRVAGLVFDAVAEGTTTVRLQSVSPFSDPSGGSVPTVLGESDIKVVPEPGMALGLAFGIAVLMSTGRSRRLPLARRSGPGSDRSTRRSPGNSWRTGCRGGRPGPSSCDREPCTRPCFSSGRSRSSLLGALRNSVLPLGAKPCGAACLPTEEGPLAQLDAAREAILGAQA